MGDAANADQNSSTAPSDDAQYAQHDASEYPSGTNINASPDPRGDLNDDAQAEEGESYSSPEMDLSGYGGVKVLPKTNDGGRKRKVVS